MLHFFAFLPTTENEKSPLCFDRTDLFSYSSLRKMTIFFNDFNFSRLTRFSRT
jgi:hypothetical protein